MIVDFRSALAATCLSVSTMCLLAEGAGAQSLRAGSGGGTTLEVKNITGKSVHVLLTLGAPPPGNPYNQIVDVRQVTGWNVTPEQTAAGPDYSKGKFVLPKNSSRRFNSGSRSLIGNIAFGPTFAGQGCGSTANNACYPNATNLAEFTLNQPGETVDLSNVNGANAKIVVNFIGGNAWNNGSWPGANENVTRISGIQPIGVWSRPSGVYGWQATNCTSVNGPPNPVAGCPAPRDGPTGPQLHVNPQCNIQRSGPSGGGTVQIVFGGYHGNSIPQPGCK